MIHPQPVIPACIKAGEILAFSYGAYPMMRIIQKYEQELLKNGGNTSKGQLE
jgi:hypothetical protein